MLRLIPLIFFFSASICCMTQSIIDQILEKPIIQVDKLDKTELHSKIFLKSDFNRATLGSNKSLARLKDKTVTQVDLVFTTYKEHISFNQLKLNRERMLELEKIAPELIRNPLIKWRLIGQNGSHDTEEAKNAFHGFVIHYRNPAKFGRSSEIKYLEAYLDGERDLSISTTTKISSTCPDFNHLGDDYWKYMIKYLKYPKGLDADPGISIASAIVDTCGTLKNIIIESSKGPAFDLAFISMLKNMPKWNPAKIGRTNIPRRVVLSGIFDKHLDLDYIELYKAYKSVSCKAVTKRTSVALDSTLYKVFNRNPEWQSMLVVTDVTGSMYPYIAQLMVWHQLNIKTNKEKVKQITFFNDGDNKKNHTKKVGSTGGIYHTKAQDFEIFKETLYSAMKAGGGGDIPENNLEAVLNAIRSCPKGKDVIMIADNYAAPRDISLAKHIGSPIKIILCGAYENINVEYLNLARRLKGSIHTMNEDITDLAKYNEGEIVNIAGKKFKLEKGKFIPMFSL